ncbi:TPA: IS1-like element transposase, partial [Escherichia coli]
MMAAKIMPICQCTSASARIMGVGLNTVLRHLKN